MKSAEIQTRISQMRKGITNNKTKLDSLRVNRGQLSIEDAEENKPVITRLDGQIEALLNALENAPVEIKLLEEQLTETQAQEAQAETDELLSQQKCAAGGMEDISVKLVKALDIANDLNLQLVAATTRYVALKEKTGQDVLVKPTCRPSEQLLQVVYECLKGELEGQPLNARCQGQPPFVRI